MHATERERLILKLLGERGFVAFQELERTLDASPATLRRDLDRLESAGSIERVRGGARLPGYVAGAAEIPRLRGAPFQENLERNLERKKAIGRAAAALCSPRESVIIDGGTTTLQMCPHLAPLELQVLSNSLHIIEALLPQAATRIAIPAGAVFREQNIVLSPFDDDGMGRYRASRMFMGAAAIGPHGIMQTDTVLAQAERRLFDRADALVVLADSSKFDSPAGHVVFQLGEVDIVVTDAGLSRPHRKMLEASGIRVVIA